MWLSGGDRPRRGGRHNARGGGRRVWDDGGGGWSAGARGVVHARVALDARGPRGRAGARGQPDDRPRTKAAQSEATMAALIAAGRELFAQRGYAGVGTEEIVKQAGVTRGALYHHFRGGKEELFRAVLVQISAETMQRVI